MSASRVAVESLYDEEIKALLALRPVLLLPVGAVESAADQPPARYRQYPRAPVGRMSGRASSGRCSSDSAAAPPLRSGVVARRCAGLIFAERRDHLAHPRRDRTLGEGQGPSENPRRECALWQCCSASRCSTYSQRESVYTGHIYLSWRERSCG